MKKGILFFLVALALTATSCNSKSAEEEVKNFGQHFVSKIAANQLDSLKACYPDIVKADSIATLKGDSISVVKESDGLYTLTLAPNVTLKVTRGDDGVIKVNSSKGLFSYPTGKLDMAKKTGLWEESLQDAELADRMDDEDFFKYLSDKVSVDKILTVDKKFHVTKEIMFMMDSGSGYYTIKNNTDQKINGSDYSIILNYVYIGGGMESNTRDIEPGKDIAPNGTVKIVKPYTGHDFIELNGVKMNIPQEELAARFLKYTGTEYKDYLKTKQK